jgi:hypothetical protein
MSSKNSLDPARLRSAIVSSSLGVEAVRLATTRIRLGGDDVTAFSP